MKTVLDINKAILKQLASDIITGMGQWNGTTIQEIKLSVNHFGDILTVVSAADKKVNIKADNVETDIVIEFYLRSKIAKITVPAKKVLDEKKYIHDVENTIGKYIFHFIRHDVMDFTDIIIPPETFEWV